MSTSKYPHIQSLLEAPHEPTSSLTTASNRAKLSSILGCDSENDSFTDSKNNSTDPLKGHTFKPDLLRYQKLAQFKVTSSLAISNNKSQVQGSLVTDQCGRFLGRTANGLIPQNRCNRRTCPMCANTRSEVITTEIIKSLDQMRFTLLDEADDDTPENDKMLGVKINLNTGITPELCELGDRVKLLSKNWFNLLRTKVVKDACIGAFRAIEIVQSTTDLNYAHPHIHGVLLVRADTNLDALNTHMRKYWHKSLKKELRKLGHETDTKASYNSLEQLYRHTKADLREWTRYATKGGYNYANDDHRRDQLSTTAQYWQEVDKVTKGMRLISLTGELKKAVALVREHFKANKTGEVKEITPVYAWSDTKGQYVPKDQYDPKIDDKVSPLCQSIPYTAYAPNQLNILFPQEYSRHKTRLAHEIKELLIKNGLSEIASNENYLSFCLNDDLFIHNKIRSTPKIGLDYSEPIEIERESLRVRTKSLDND